MHLIDTLRNKIGVLDDGDYMHGLQAVLLHIETAGRHLTRGQESDDETAFTDAIYRTNQAFEGSVKEAYRVLAGKNPDKERPYDIELYLESNNIFRSRVMNQLAIYRKEWRNPSIHDYKLDFDESESFLAIVTVSAFACLLLDQIAEKLSFMRAQLATQAMISPTNMASEQPSVMPLLEQVLDYLSMFCESTAITRSAMKKNTGAQAIGAIHGFLATVAPDLKIETEKDVVFGIRFRSDMVISNGDEVVVVEIRTQLRGDRLIGAVVQMEDTLSAGGMMKGIIVVLPETPGAMERLNAHTYLPNGELVALIPHGSSSTLQGRLRFAPRP
ncbi:hypothetical protein ALQ34_01501 [Pseudomonas syringae pv. maculicola]|uniref:hypothetical protein n=1 Tax=Pseudomonas syringae group genomosp. 3 TaxID=251701 RepID=UPI000F3D1D0B|nr:hypothetical protein [Pseudomonas syringae group genomosp. 3]RMO84932.1 hypothetical protein ALQ34_01501 [Pseudomonas syringae pv. maculicola]